ARSVRGEQLRAGRADPAGGAGDQPGPAGQPPLSSNHRCAQPRHLPVTARPTGTAPACTVAEHSLNRRASARVRDVSAWQKLVASPAPDLLSADMRPDRDAGGRGMLEPSHAPATS